MVLQFVYYFTEYQLQWQSIVISETQFATFSNRLSVQSIIRQLNTRFKLRLTKRANFFACFLGLLNEAIFGGNKTNKSSFSGPILLTCLGRNI